MAINASVAEAFLWPEALAAEHTGLGSVYGHPVRRTAFTVTPVRRNVHLPPPLKPSG